MKAELEMADDPVYNLWLFDEGDNPHLAAASRTQHLLTLKELEKLLDPEKFLRVHRA